MTPVDSAILEAIARWVEEDDCGQRILLDLSIDRPCPLCAGTTFCPAGCRMAVCDLDYEKAEHRRLRPVREHEHRRGEDGWEEVLIAGTECETCTIYGSCLSCFPDGKERRRACKEGSAYLIDGIPLYSVPGFQLTDPIKITVARVAKEIKKREEGQLDLLGVAA